MECLPMFSLLALILLSFLILETASLKYYVTPNKAIGCSNNLSTCLTLQEYAHQQYFFANNTVFYFEPGSHRLNSNLTLMSLHNLTFQGLPGNERLSVNVSLGSLVTITWKECWNVEICSITVSLVDEFNIGIIFEYSHLAQLSNISVYGNGYCGCRAILSKNSTLYIRDAIFAGIQGIFGAALLISGSYVIFTGNNMFIGNSAVSGGSLCLFESKVILNGNYTFLNNSSPKQLSDCNCTRLLPTETEFIDSYDSIGYGGAIVCLFSSLTINSGYSIFVNNFAPIAGGAIRDLDGNITILGSALFERNIACELNGGAISFNGENLILQGNISFINNSAPIGGALSIMQGILNISSSKGWQNQQFLYYDIIKELHNWNAIIDERCVNSNISMPIAADYRYVRSVLDNIIYSKKRVTFISRNSQVL